MGNATAPAPPGLAYEDFGYEYDESNGTHATAPDYSYDPDSVGKEEIDDEDDDE